jgi:hypothetical protein
MNYISFLVVCKPEIYYIVYTVNHIEQQKGVNMIVHLRYNGSSREVNITELGVTNDSDDATILSSLAEHFDISLQQLQSDSIVDRGESGIVVRPKAVYG